MANLFSRIFRDTSGLVQFAALPFRQDGTELMVCLVTSRGSGRLIIPKGWPEPGLEPHQVAAHEAFEEAGLLGEIDAKPIGAYSYRKSLHLFASVTCRVDVFPLRVTAERENWPESTQRMRVWRKASAAAKAVREPDLSKLIQSFANSW